MDKVKTIEEAIANIHDGQTIMIGGFGGNGSPHSLIEALIAKGVKDLTIICNDAGNPNFGVGRFFKEKRVKKLYASFIGANPEACEDLANGEFEVVLIPQGTLAESIRAGGAGLGGILTKTGIGTLVSEGKQKINIKGEDYLVEEAIHADVALIYAAKVDRIGNVSYHGSSRAHSPSMAMAADYVVVEAKEIVEVGEINPDNVHTQSVFINSIVLKGEQK